MVDCQKIDSMNHYFQWSLHIEAEKDSSAIGRGWEKLVHQEPTHKPLERLEMIPTDEQKEYFAKDIHANTLIAFILRNKIA